MCTCAHNHQSEEEEEEKFNNKKDNIYLYTCIRNLYKCI